MSFFSESRSRSPGLYSIIGQNAKCKKKNCGEREKKGGEGKDKTTDVPRKYGRCVLAKVPRVRRLAWSK